MAKLPGKICSSCGKQAQRYIEFSCPSCGKGTVVRCDHCRETYVKYKCAECKFEGP